MLIRERLISLLVILFLFQKATAQETTAALSGIVQDAMGASVTGATINIKHEPTGYSVGTQSRNKGIFVVPNLKPGGPYRISVSYMGYTDVLYSNIYLTLGNNYTDKIILRPALDTLTEITVATRGKRFYSGTTITKNQLAVLPSLGRSLADFTRVTPQANNNSFAGTNFRYNNLTIDGANNNDAIGFSNSIGGTAGAGQSGAAGAGTRTNPYSLDVIQEVQVQLAPFDVKQGSFTGGSINAITKSGSNFLHGSIYAYGRNKYLMGQNQGKQNTKIGSEFHDYQYGATLSGPLVRNKAFFIINFEQTRRQEHTFYNIGDPGAAITADEAEQVYGYLAEKGYDAGAYKGAYKLVANSDKLFSRIDLHLSAANTLSLRAIYTHGWGNNLERSSNNFQFGSTDFTQHNYNVNISAELKTKFSNTLNNQFNISLIKVHEYREFPGKMGPFIDIDNGRIWAGTWREASIYNTRNSTLELSDNITIIKGINKFTLGTHNELYDIQFGYVNSWNGRWEYARGVQSFLNDNPSRIRGTFLLADSVSPKTRDEIYNKPLNPFRIYMLSAYLQDDIMITNGCRISPGIRIDYTGVGKQPGFDNHLAEINNTPLQSPGTYSSPQFATITNRYFNNYTWSPRLGLTLNLTSDGAVVFRGGTGIFSGRLPFAWLGYGYNLNGLTYGNIEWSGLFPQQPVPLATETNGLKDTVTKYSALYRAGVKTNTKELNIVDRNFKMPRVWRSNAAFDYRPGNGFKITFDALYTKTLYDVMFKQINLFDSVSYYSSGPVQSPVYLSASPFRTDDQYDPAYSNIFLLTNSTKGYRYNLTLQVSQLAKDIIAGTGHSFDYGWSIAYTYGKSQDVSNGIRNSWESNYNLNAAIIGNNPALANSTFECRHRVVATGNVVFHWNEGHRSTLALFYSGQSGNPYTLVYQGAVGTGGSSAPLPYIPKNASDIRLVDYMLKGQVYTAAQQWEDLNNFIQGNAYLRSRRGRYAERNGLHTPWVHEIDLKLLHEIILSKTNRQHSLQISLDIFNVLNLLNHNWGQVNFVSNINQYNVNFLRYASYNIDPGTGQPIAIPPGTFPQRRVGAPGSGYIPTFHFIKPGGIQNQYYSQDPINSRWQQQLGLKYSF